MKKGSIAHYLALVSQLGVSMVISIAVGMYAGIYVDKTLNKNGIFTIIGIIAGVAAGFLSVYRLIVPHITQKDKDESPRA